MTGDLSLHPVEYCTVTKSQKQKSVEGKLWEMYGALARTEGNIHLISTLKSLALCTNDVRSFVLKQTLHKKSIRTVDHRVMKSAMQSKLPDACSYAKKEKKTNGEIRCSESTKIKPKGRPYVQIWLKVTEV